MQLRMHKGIRAERWALLRATQQRGHAAASPVTARKGARATHGRLTSALTPRIMMDAILLVRAAGGKGL